MIRSLHRGGAECRAGGSDTPSVPEAVCLTGRCFSGGGGRVGAMTCAARIVFYHINGSKVNSSNAKRAADAVVPNLAYPPEERLPTTDIEPLARSECRCRRRGAPPCRRRARGGGQLPVLLPVRARNSFWLGPTKYFRVGRYVANSRSINSHTRTRTLPKRVSNLSNLVGIRILPDRNST